MGYIAIGNIEEEFVKVRRETERKMIFAFRRALVHGLDEHPRTCRLVREALSQLPPLDGAAWMIEGIGVLTGLIARQRSEYGEQQDVLHQIRRERDELKQKVEDYEGGLLEEQIAALTGERNFWRREVVEAGGRIEMLEAALDRSQRAYDAETRRLQERVDELNHLVVEQQEALNKLVS